MLDQIIGEKSNAIAANQILNVIKGADLNGSFYIGYPILATTDETVFIDALLTSLEHGVVVFHFSDFDAPPEDLSLLRKKQDELFNTVDVKLRQYPPLLEGRTLPFEIKIVSIIPGLAEHIREEPLLATSPELLLGLLNEFAPISEEILTKINASVQRVTSIKPLRKRTYVKNEDSRGAIIKEIEKNIANLDQWQKKGAIEFPEGVQRIRGLAGSGKTIVLALKAAYLHTAHPEWDIRVTFHTRALSQQLKDLIRRFTFEHINDEPDWDKLRVIHTWGSTSDLGIYSEIALNHNIEPRNFTYGRQKYTYEHAFEGVCKELIDIIGKKNIKPIYDVMLIDEAQDLPQSFFELAYLATNEPRKIVYAYDELQNLSDYSMTPPEKLFGRDDQGTPRVPDLRNEDGAPKRDIVLPICYRNTPWALSMAHALGFGIYREQGLVQFFDNPSLLSEVGYEILDGDLNPGSSVVLKRKKDSSPHYFDKIFPEDAIDFKVFDDKRDQAEALAKSIKDDLTHGELEYRDILVIISNPLTSKKEAAILVHELNNLDISAHLAGVTSSRDRLFLWMIQ